MATRYRIEGLVDDEWSWKNVVVGSGTEASVTFADREIAESEMARLAHLMGHATSRKLRVVPTEAFARTRQQQAFTMSDEARAKLSRLASKHGTTKTAFMEKLILAHDE